MHAVTTPYEEFIQTIQTYPSPINCLVVGRYHDYGELEHTPKRILPYTSQMPLKKRLYRSLPFISTLAGSIRILEAIKAPLHPKDRCAHKIELLCGVIELLGLGILLFIFDIVRYVLAFIFSLLSMLALDSATVISRFSHPASQQMLRFSMFLGELSEVII